MTNYRMVIIGDGGVGKSCIVIQYLQNVFYEDYDPTLEDNYRKQVMVDGEMCSLDIFDTAGQEEFKSIRDLYMQSGEGFVCVYSIDSFGAFEECMALYEQVLRVKGSDSIPFVLVGNKCDLEERREVPREEVVKFAEAKRIKHIEASAKTRYNIEEIFELLIREINLHRNGGYHVVGDNTQDIDVDKEIKKAKKKGKKAKKGNKCTLL